MQSITIESKKRERMAAKMGASSQTDISSKQEIWVLPFQGQGHLLPSIELCKHIASRNSTAALIISPKISSAIPASLSFDYPLLKVVELPSSPSPPLPPSPQAESGDISLQPHLHHFHNHQSQLQDALEKLIASSKPPACVVVDVLIGWTCELFKKFEVPTIAFFTSGACSSAIGYAVWKAQVDHLNPGETRLLPGLPHEMTLTGLDFRRKPPPLPPPQGGMQGGPPGGFQGPRRNGPPRQGERPRWLEETEDSIAFLFNTCDELELPFISYLSKEFEKPIWGIGPLLPDKYWKSIVSTFHDREVRANQESNVTEDDVIRWLHSK